MITKDPFR